MDDSSLIVFWAVVLGLTLCLLTIHDGFSQSSQKQNGRHISRHRVYYSPTSRAELRRNGYFTYNF